MDWLIVKNCAQIPRKVKLKKIFRFVLTTAIIRFAMCGAKQHIMSSIVCKQKKKYVCSRKRKRIKRERETEIVKRMRKRTLDVC